jgi:MmyB-like transcription regulator ligand binding domain
VSVLVVAGPGRVADLRAVDPGSPELEALVTELSAASAEFAELWQHYDVRVNSGGLRRFRHPAVGLFELTSEVLTAVDGQRLLVFQARGGADHDAITLLAMGAGTRRLRYGGRVAQVQRADPGRSHHAQACPDHAFRRP